MSIHRQGQAAAVRLIERLRGSSMRLARKIQGDTEVAFTKRSFPRRLLPFAVAGLWLAGSLVSLTRYPPMHADEAWLASETRSILVERSFAATAEFFHITERSPHAIRLLFHLLQAPFVSANWSLASVRLVSILCGAAAALLACLASRRLFTSAAAAILFVAGLSLDPLFIASSHLARQEIVLTACFPGIAALYLRRPAKGTGHDAVIAVVIGLSIGFHANSLPVAIGIGALYLMDLLWSADRRLAFRRLSVLVAVTAACALIWAGSSRLLSADFPRAYVEFGARYGVGESLPVKLLELPDFYSRLYDRITGTYHLPPLRLTLLLFAIASLAGIAMVCRRIISRAPAAAAALARPLAALAGVNLGLILIGKYSQPSAVLLLPAGYWLAAAVLDAFVCRWGSRSACRLAPEPGRRKVTAGPRPSRRRAFARQAPQVASVVFAVALATANGVTAVRDAVPWMTVSYERYIERIARHVPPDARVIASLNTAFAFEPGALYAINDLEALAAEGLSFDGYVDRFKIEYILYPDEIDRIYAERPVWNDLYGNVALYYAQMKRFLAEECEAVAVYEEPVFAMRILLYHRRYGSTLTIYRVRG